MGFAPLNPSYGQLRQQVERDADRLPAHLGAADVAEAHLAVKELAAPRGGEMDEADGLVRRPAARTGDSGDRDREVGARLCQRALRHGFGGRAAHCAVRRESRGRDREHELFRLVRVGDEAAIDHVGRPRESR